VDKEKSKKTGRDRGKNKMTMTNDGERWNCAANSGDKHSTPTTHKSIFKDILIKREKRNS
jgi:hypothetical protein